jgi:DNA-binding MarR family transcriptional regulator
MPGSYPFPMYSGLLETRHYKNIGTAIWFFLWCVSSTTSEEERDGELWGNVLGKKPLKLSELAEPFMVNEKTISRWLEALEQHEYIQVNRAPYGLMIQVRKSKKFLKRTDKDVSSDKTEQTNMSDLSPTEQTKMSDLNGENRQKCLISPESPDKNVRSNKDIINNSFTATTTAADSFEDLLSDDVPKDSPLKQLEGAYCKLHSIGEWHVKPKDFACMQSMIAGGMPVPFIIETMQRIYSVKAEQGQKINSFTYYRDAIVEAWQKHNQPIEPIVIQSHQPSKPPTGKGYYPHKPRKPVIPVVEKKEGQQATNADVQRILQLAEQLKGDAHER